MQADDTVKLLKECDLGVKMAISSIQEIEEKVTDQALKQILMDAKRKHTKLEQEIYDQLKEMNEPEKEPGMIAKGMSWMKTNVEMVLDQSDQTIAKLVTGGCNMGIQTLNHHLNQDQNASESVKKICEKLILMEEELEKQMRSFL